VSELAIAVAFVVTAFVCYMVAIQRREMVVLRRTLTDHVRSHVQLPEEDDNWVWPEAVLEIGTRFPADLQSKQPSWTILVLTRPGCHLCEEVLRSLRLSEYELPVGYVIRLATALHDPDPGIPGIGVIRLTDVERSPTPALLLIAPDGTIQGKGRVGDGYTLAHFVEEGLAHGYGPPEVLDEAISKAVERSGRVAVAQPHSGPP